MAHATVDSEFTPQELEVLQAFFGEDLWDPSYELTDDRSNFSEEEDSINGQDRLAEDSFPEEDQYSGLISASAPILFPVQDLIAVNVPDTFQASYDEKNNSIRSNHDQEALIVQTSRLTGSTSLVEQPDLTGPPSILEKRNSAISTDQALSNSTFATSSSPGHHRTTRSVNDLAQGSSVEVYGIVDNNRRDAACANRHVYDYGHGHDSFSNQTPRLRNKTHINPNVNPNIDPQLPTAPNPAQDCTYQGFFYPPYQHHVNPSMLHGNLYQTDFSYQHMARVQQPVQPADFGQSAPNGQHIVSGHEITTNLNLTHGINSPQQSSSDRTGQSANNSLGLLGPSGEQSSMAQAFGGHTPLLPYDSDYRAALRSHRLANRKGSDFPTDSVQQRILVERLVQAMKDISICTDSETVTIQFVNGTITDLQMVISAWDSLHRLRDAQEWGRIVYPSKATRYEEYETFMDRFIAHELSRKVDMMKIFAVLKDSDSLQKSKAFCKSLLLPVFNDRAADAPRAELRQKGTNKFLNGQKTIQNKNGQRAVKEGLVNKATGEWIQSEGNNMEETDLSAIEPAVQSNKRRRAEPSGTAQQAAKRTRARK